MPASRTRDVDIVQFDPTCTTEDVKHVVMAGDDALLENGDYAGVSEVRNEQEVSYLSSHAMSLETSIASDIVTE